jgi:hypothetical protein
VEEFVVWGASLKIWIWGGVGRPFVRVVERDGEGGRELDHGTGLVAGFLKREVPHAATEPEFKAPD